MVKKLIDETSRYRFERIYEGGSNMCELGSTDKLSTTFIHHGSVALRFPSQKNRGEVFKLSQGQGFILAPGISCSLYNSGRLVAYTVSSKIDRESPIVEIIEFESDRKEVVLGDFRIIRDPKRVEKPWGHELWVSWFMNHHVLKQIGMSKGMQSSLQFHREKLETNYLESGRADVIEGYKLNPLTPEEEVLKSLDGINFDEYKKRMSPGDHWTSQAGTAHRVMAVTDYLAYEVSTPELDDVIRLQDDSCRNSGRIDSEHMVAGGKKWEKTEGGS
ncbi:MAG: hypothetical protein V1889_03685 [archaeon]